MNKNKIVAAFLSSIMISPLALAAKENVEIPVKIKPEREALLRELARDQVKKKVIPMMEDEANEIKRLMMENEKIMEKNLFETEIVNKSIPLRLKPDQAAPVINIYKNYSSTITILDKSGNPWDIEKFSIPSEDFTYKVLANNIIQLTPKKNIVRTNLTFMLEKAKYPLSIILESSPKEVYDKTVISIQEYGPDSKAGIVAPMTSGKMVDALFDDEDYLDFLDGVTPEGATKREVYSLDGTPVRGQIEAWSKGDLIFLRMKNGFVLSPDSGSPKSDSYGNRIFTIEATFAPEVLINFNGHITSIKII